MIYYTSYTGEKKLSVGLTHLWDLFYEILFCLQIYLAKEQAQHYILGYPPKFWATTKSQDENLLVIALLKAYSSFFMLAKIQKI